MATDLGDLEKALGRELGDIFTAEEMASLDLIDLLERGVDALNGEGVQEFVLTGTTLDRTATMVEKRAIVLMAAEIYVRGKAVGSSGDAIVHSNVAGRTDLSGIEFAMAKRAKEIRERLTPILERIQMGGVVSEVTAQELGETLEVGLTRPVLTLSSYW